MKALVFGVNGQVGRALLALEDDGLAIDPVARSRADLMDPTACADTIMQTDADVIINAAAWTAVDKAEDNTTDARTVNADSPIAMAEACAKRGLPFVHISSDYVLAGDGEAPQSETAPLAPLSVYGATKAAAETGIRDVMGDAPYGILRTSWVFSGTGANFVGTMLRLGQTRETLNIVADQIGGPTPASSIAQACVQLARTLKDSTAESGVYNFSGAPDVSWADFAKAIFDTAKLPVTVRDIGTADYPTPAPRPLNSRLDCAKIFTHFGIQRPDWRAQLPDVINSLKSTAE